MRAALQIVGRVTRRVALLIGPIILVAMGCMLVTLLALYRLTLAQGT